jgi:hypothetical protein
MTPLPVPVEKRAWQLLIGVLEHDDVLCRTIPATKRPRNARGCMYDENHTRHGGGKCHGLFLIAND